MADSSLSLDDQDADWATDQTGAAMDPTAAMLMGDGGTDNSNPAKVPSQDETDEAWRLRFLDENAHLAPPPLARVATPAPMLWDGPPLSWRVPERLSMPHPRGGYMPPAITTSGNVRHKLRGRCAA